MHLNSSVAPLLLLIATGSAAWGQSLRIPDSAETQPADLSTLHVDAGLELRLVIDRGFQIKGVEQRVTGRITEPVFAGDRLVIPSGTLVHGHISSITHTGPRLATMLGGDFSRPTEAHVTFDTMTLASGETVPLSSAEAAPLEPAKTFLYIAKKDRPALLTSAKEQIGAVVHAPNKLQKVSEAAVTSLPYHPQFLDEGTRFNVTVTGSLDLPLESLPVVPTSPADSGNRLHVRLLTPLNSHSIVNREPIQAVVAEPFYDRTNRLVFSAGSVLTGQVTHAQAARWFQRQGALNFQFSSITNGDTEHALSVVTVGAEAGRDEALSIDTEGMLKGTRSHLKQLTAPLSLIGPSRGLSDSSLEKTAFQRGGQGRKGFGFVGFGLAQASASTAVGFGYYGAARKLYSAFIAKGTDVSLPADTNLLLAVRD